MAVPSPGFSVSSADDDERAVGRRRDAHDRAGRERDDADLELVRHLVEERLRGDTRRVEPRRLDVVRLHRARDVDREDDRRLLALHVDGRVRPRDADDEEDERDEQRQRRQVAEPTRAAVDDVREQVGIPELGLRRDPPAVAIDVDRDEDRERRERRERERPVEAHARLLRRNVTSGAEPVAGRREDDMPHPGRRQRPRDLRALGCRRDREALAQADGCACRRGAGVRSRGRRGRGARRSCSSCSRGSRTSTATTS